MKKLNKRGQVGIEDAPNVIIIVGLTFLIMATLALVAQKYGEAMPSDIGATVSNESVTKVQRELTSHKLLGTAHCAAENFAISEVWNGTAARPTLLTTGNYSISAAGVFTNTTDEVDVGQGTWVVSYTYKHVGTACNITQALQTEISNNTSIAGIVLTISLVGIILTVLIGIFVGFRGRGV